MDAAVDLLMKECRSAIEGDIFAQGCKLTKLGPDEVAAGACSEQLSTETCPPQSRLLSDRTKKNVDSVAEMSAAMLKLYRVTHDGCVLALQRETDKHAHLNRELALRRRQVEIINRRINSVHRKFHHLKALSAVEHDSGGGGGGGGDDGGGGGGRDIGSSSSSSRVDELTRKQSQYEYLASKCTRYSTQIAHLRKRLDLSANFSHHAALTDRADRISKVKAEICAIKHELDTYMNFPTDKNLAKVKLEEAKRQLELLELNLTRQIDLKDS